MKLYQASLKGFTISEHQCEPEKSLYRLLFYVYAGGSGSRGHDFDEDQDVALLHQEKTWRAWLTTCCKFLVNIPLP